MAWSPCSTHQCNRTTIFTLPHGRNTLELARELLLLLLLESTDVKLQITCFSSFAASIVTLKT